MARAEPFTYTAAGLRHMLSWPHGSERVEAVIDQTVASIRDAAVIEHSWPGWNTAPYPGVLGRLQDQIRQGHEDAARLRAVAMDLQRTRDESHQHPYSMAAWRDLDQWSHTLRSQTIFGTPRPPVPEEQILPAAQQAAQPQPGRGRRSGTRRRAGRSRRI
jgi:hypothetical protein